jgi:mono/diheme cytochrome c family protein
MVFDTGLSTTSAIALAVMAGIFIVFALISSFVMPARNPDFPGKRFRWAYVVLCVVLFALMMSTVVVFGKEDEEKHAEETAQEHPGQTTSTETSPAPTTSTPTTTQGGGQFAGGDAAAGKELFAAKGCGVCHTMEAAGSSGTIGPNLDEAKPSEELIADRLIHGKGQMPPFRSQLTDKQIADLVAFIRESTSGS